MTFLALPVRACPPTFSPLNHEMISSNTTAPVFSAMGWTGWRHEAVVIVVSL